MTLRNAYLLHKTTLKFSREERPGSISRTDLSLFWGLNVIQSDSWLGLSLSVKSAPGKWKTRKSTHWMQSSAKQSNLSKSHFWTLVCTHGCGWHPICKPYFLAHIYFYGTVHMCLAVSAHVSVSQKNRSQMKAYMEI